MYPNISIIIPVYNTSRYLRQCLNSILSQTLTDIEIICVDDGSTDNSLDILNEYKLKDSRIIVLHQKNRGGGAARNLGMSIAQGKYLSFLDSDDFFQHDMLQCAYDIAEKHNADVTIFLFREYYDNVSMYSEKEFGISNVVGKDTNIVSRNDIPSSIFSLTNPAPWNKLYNREFVERHNLHFQEIAKCNDVYFGFTTLYFAEKIALLNKSLASYRTGTITNTQATTYKNPCDIYYALLSIHEHLRDTPAWEIVEKGFVNVALRHCIGQLDKLRVSYPDAFNELCSLLNSEGYDKLGISKYSKSDFGNHWDFWKYQHYLSIDKGTEHSLSERIFEHLFWSIYLIYYYVHSLVHSHLHPLKTENFSRTAKRLLYSFRRR